MDWFLNLRAKNFSISLLISRWREQERISREFLWRRVDVAAPCKKAKKYPQKELFPNNVMIIALKSAFSFQILQLHPARVRNSLKCTSCGWAAITETTQKCQLEFMFCCTVNLESSSSTRDDNYWPYIWKIKLTFKRETRAHKLTRWKHDTQFEIVHASNPAPIFDSLSFYLRGLDKAR